MKNAGADRRERWRTVSRLIHGGHEERPKVQVRSDINVTPLVDVVLVLLIVFIVAAKVVSTPAVELDLPAAATGGEVQIVFSVLIDAQGQVTVDGAPVASDEGFLRLATEAKVKDGDLRAVIHADGGTAHRRVVHVIDLLKRAGIAKVAFATSFTAAPEPITP